MGSNPTLSASCFKEPLEAGAFCFSRLAARQFINSATWFQGQKGCSRAEPACGKACGLTGGSESAQGVKFGATILRRFRRAYLGLPAP